MEGLKNVRKTYEWGGGLLEMYESVQGGRGGGGGGGGGGQKLPNLSVRSL